MTALLIILALICLLAGLAGTVYPAVPGLPLMFGGAWLLAYSSDYQIVGGWTLAVLGVVAAIGFATDFFASLLGAKYTGASKEAVWGAFIGGIAGIFLGIPGLLLGPLAGAAVGEYGARRCLLQAGKVGIGTFIGFILGVVAKIGTALVIILVLAWCYLAQLFV